MELEKEELPFKDVVINEDVKAKFMHEAQKLTVYDFMLEVYDVHHVQYAGSKFPAEDRIDGYQTYCSHTQNAVREDPSDYCLGERIQNVYIDSQLQRYPPFPAQVSQ